MNIQKFYDEQSTYNLSPEFTAKLAEIKPVFDDYMTAQRKANHSFMLIVGELQEYRLKTVNKEDKEAIRVMLNGLNQDKIDTCYAAFKAYKELKSIGTPEYEQLAEKATPTQLKFIGRGKDTTLAFDAAMALKKTGKVPTVEKLRVQLKGYTDKQFNSSGHSHKTTVNTVPSTPDTTLTPASPEAKSAFQLKCEAADEMIKDVNYRYIHDRDSAETYLSSTTNATIASCMESISRLKTCDEKRVKQLKHLIQLAKAALELPAVYEHSYFGK